MSESADNSGLQHPVPQNVIEVEFKLFGSFTLKQFGKILFGSLGAIALFPTPLPFYVKFPLMFLSIALGVGTALNPFLGKWLKNYVKAMIVSPRYVWIKKVSTPESLRTKSPEQVAADQARAKQSSGPNRAVDLSDISLDRVLSSLSSGEKQAPKAEESDIIELAGNDSFGNVRTGNLNRLFSTVYEENVNAANNQAKTSSGEAGQSNNDIKSDTQANQINQLETIQDYMDEITDLKKQLAELNKRQHSQAEEQKLINKINDLYKQLSVINRQSSADNSTAGTNSTNEQGSPSAGQRNIMGIAVDSNDNPVPEALVRFHEHNNKYDDVIIKTSSDGRFVTPKPLNPGKYDIYIQHPQFQFHTYTIDVTKAKQPAYKFRAR